MKDPVRLPSASIRAAKPSGKKPKTGRKALSKASKGGRPRRRVPGGKALARLNMFLIQRGASPEPTEPPPPALPAEPGAATKAAERASPADRSPAAGLVAGYSTVRSELAAAMPVSQTWQPLGPFFMPHGQSYGKGPASRPSVAGRVSAIAIDPGDDRHILCGAAGGGVWETRDGGRTWSPRCDEQPSLSIGAVAFDPSDPTRVYAGTGEGNDARSTTGNIRAAGLLVSDDGGATWSVMPGATFVGVSFYGLVVDPSNSDHLLAATTDGLYETSDRGATWSRRREPLTWSVSMHPQVPTNPAAGREVLAAFIDGLFRSTDGGTNWTKVNLPSAPGGDFQRMEARHAPSNGSIAYVFAAGGPEVRDPFWTPNDPVMMRTPYLWRRSTFDGAFAAVGTLPRDLQTGQAWYDWFAAVAPNNPDVVYLGAINVHRGVRAPNGKWAWTNVSAKKPTGDCIHPDQHVIAFSPTDANVVYVGNDGGLYRSPDAGVSWESLNKGLSITEIEFLAQHPEYDAWLLAGTQDNGTIRYEGQQTWYHVQDGDGGDCGVDNDDPYTCYHSFWGAYVGKSDGGGAWNDWNTTTPDELNNENSLFYPPLEVNGALVVRGATRVWLSRDRGDSWEARKLPGLQSGGNDPELPSALTAPSNAVAYVGTTRGKIFRLSWSGAAWTVAPLASPAAGGYVSDILVDSTSANDLWCSVNVAGQGGVYHSADGGATWSAASSGLPSNVAVHAIEIDSQAPATLFAATDVGVFRTVDSGSNWIAFGRGLPNALAKDLLLHPKARLLRVGTQARGVWEIALDGATMPDVQIYLRDHAADSGRSLPSPVDVPNPFGRGTNLFWWQSPDIKIDASPFETRALDDLDFDVYSDDRSKRDGGLEFATGLLDERPVRGQVVRVYVQAHNRGSVPAQNVAVRVFYVAGGLNWPDLPAGFWGAFPNGALPADSAWQAVAPHRVIPRIDPGRSAVIGFDWSVPMTVGSAVGLLAVISADNDTVATTTLNVADLVRNSRYCALRNLAVINPAPIIGPTSHAIPVDVWPTAAVSSLNLDRQVRSLLRGVVLPKELGAGAKKAGWKAIKVSKEDGAHLTRVCDARPELKKQLDLRRAFHPPAKSRGLELAPLANGAPQPIILLLRSDARRGAGSVVLREPGGEVRGGLTIMNLANAQ